MKSATILLVKISAVIITFNEEAKVALAIESVAWADEIIVVDSESSDRTPEIAEAAGARVIIRKWEGFSGQKQLAVDQAENDWVFSLDADERVSQDLRNEILALKVGNMSADGYRIPRMSIYMDVPIRHGGWYPDCQLRLFNRTKGRWKNVLVHESFQMDDGAQTATLAGDILHYSVENAAHHHQMIGERYAPLAARQMFADGRRASRLKIALAGPAAFVRTYILKAGFLDGLPGFVIAKFAAHHAFLKQTMLWELQHSKTNVK
ncbi:MAG: glycosyltransferase family 2 protein [Pyrinomonadaceae bacterium]